MAEVYVYPPEYEETECKGTLLFWYKKEGEQVEEGEELAEVETAKAVVSVVTPTSGVLKEILVGEGEEVESVQAKLAVITTE